MDNETGKKLAEWVGAGNKVTVMSNGGSRIGVLESFNATSLRIKDNQDTKVHTVSYSNIIDIEKGNEIEVEPEMFSVFSSHDNQDIDDWSLVETSSKLLFDSTPSDTHDKDDIIFDDSKSPKPK